MKPRVSSTDEQFLQLAREDFQTFMALVHKTDMPEVNAGHATAARHHDRMVAALVNDSLGHTVIVAPRGSGKTTLVQGFLEWDLGRASLGRKGWEEQWRVLYVSNTATQAQRISNAIRATIEGNPMYQAIFPRVKPHRDKWGQEEWKVNGNQSKDPNFVAIGVGGPALGFRAQRIVFDDVADQENMATEHQRTTLVGTEDGSTPGWLDLTALPVLVPGAGRAIMVGTRWAWNDPIAWAERRGWHQLLIKALDENGSYWPERFTVEWLERERAHNPRAFAKSYQNEVAPEEGLIFERAWFGQRFDWLPSEFSYRPDSWDTAIGEGRNRSYSVGLSAVVTPDLHLYVHHMFRGQVPYTYLKEAIRVSAERNNATHVIIEMKSSGHPAAQELALEGLPIVGWQPAGQRGALEKQRMREMVADFCRMGRLHLPSDFFCRQSGDATWLQDFEREVFSYPDGDTDDAVDALCQLIVWVKTLDESRQRLLMQPRAPVPWAKPRGERLAV